jgi:hypothetical protein
MKDKKLWKELIHLHCAEGQPTKTVLAQTCMGVFFIRSVSDKIIAKLFLPKSPTDRYGPPGEPLRTTVWETRNYDMAPFLQLYVRMVLFPEGLNCYSRIPWALLLRSESSCCN